MFSRRKAVTRKCLDAEGPGTRNVNTTVVQPSGRAGRRLQCRIRKMHTRIKHMSIINPCKLHRGVGRPRVIIANLRSRVIVADNKFSRARIHGYYIRGARWAYVNDRLQRLITRFIAFVTKPRRSTNDPLIYSPTN